MLSRRTDPMKMAVFALMGALSLLFSPAQGDAAVGASVSGCLRDKGVTETGALQQTLALRHVEVCGTNTKRVVIVRVAIGATARRVDMGLGDGALGRAGALLRIEPVTTDPL